MIHKRHRLLTVIAWVLALGVMIFIFTMSAQTAQQSSRTSSTFARIIAEILTPGFRSMTKLRQWVITGSYQHITRKIAHFSEYAVLGALLFVAFRDMKKHGGLAAIFGAVGFAVLDELHQLSVSGRSAQLTDVLIDAGGAVIGVGVMLLIRFIRRCGASRR